MITEDYCSYELSKLLKEKGFDVSWCDRGWDISCYDVKQSRMFSHGYDNKNNWIEQPTLSLAMKWLREVHGLFAQIGYYEDWADDADGKKVDSWNYWGIDIFYLPSGLRVDPEITDQYDTYEEAVEAAIKYSLENLI